MASRRCPPGATRIASFRKSAIGEVGFKSSSINGLVTEVIALNHLDPTDAARMLKPVIDAQGRVITNPTSRTLIVVDYASNLPRVRELLAQIDRDPSVTETINLKNIAAGELSAILTSLSASSGEKWCAIDVQGDCIAIGKRHRALW